MAPDLDRTGWDGVGATESHGHSLVGATGPREPGRGLSRVPTDDEFVHSVVSQDEMTQGASLRAARRARAISACLLMGPRREAYCAVAKEVQAANARIDRSFTSLSAAAPSSSSWT